MCLLRFGQITKILKSAIFILTVFAFSPQYAKTQTATTPSILINPSSYIFSVNTPSNTRPPETSGFSSSVYYITTPSLPAGLNLDSTNGQITGIPTAPSTQTAYRITAKESGTYGNSASYVIYISINNSPNYYYPQPGLSYPMPGTYSLALNQTIGTISPTTNYTSHSISPSLPTGLYFNSTTGAITGTPQSLSSITPYTVTGSGPNGTMTSTFSLEVLSGTVTTTAGGYIQPYPNGPYVFYLNSLYQNNVGTTTPYTFTVGQPVNIGIPQTSGLTSAVNYSVTPPLPQGINLNPIDGSITGVASSTSLYTVYTIVATGLTAGTGSGTISMEILPTSSIGSTISFNYSPQYTLMNGDYLPQDYITARVKPTVTSGSVTSYSISPNTLPFGLNFDQTTGVVYGTISGTINGTYDYTVFATNGMASATSQLKLVIGTSGASSGTMTTTSTAPVFSYISPITSTSFYTLKTGEGVNYTYVTGIRPTVINGSVSSYSIIGALPSNLLFDNLTGIITGVPSSTFSETTFTVVGSNGTYSSTATFTLSVIAGTSSGTYSNTNNGGSATGTFIYSQTSPIVAGGMMTANNFLFETGAAFVLEPGNTGLQSPTFTITPCLPVGWYLDRGTGVIRGTASNSGLSMGTTNYLITATGSSGNSLTAPITISINSSPNYSSSLYGGTGSFVYNQSSPLPTVSTTVNKFIYSNENTFTLEPGSTGLVSPVYSITPSVPFGWSFDQSTGIITGTISGTTYLSGSTNYLIKATGSNCATSTAPIVIEISSGISGGTMSSTIGSTSFNYLYPPVYTSSSYTLNVGQGVYSMYAFGIRPRTTGSFNSFSIIGSLPANLNFDNLTGEITGAPTSIFPETMYTVIGSNGTLTSTATFTLSVVSGTSSGTITPPPGNYTPIAGLTYQQMLPIPAYPTEVNKFSFKIGDVFELRPSSLSGISSPTYSVLGKMLPSSFAIDPITGIITGTASQTMAIEGFNIVATGSNGTVSTTIIITVRDPNLDALIPPYFSYPRSPYVLNVNGNPGDIKAETSYGSVNSYSIDKPLPAGLYFDNINGQIYGSPKVVMQETLYTVTGINSTGTLSSTASFRLSVTSGLATTMSQTVITYFYAGPYSLKNGDILSRDFLESRIWPSVTGGTVTKYSISPNLLPDGLNFDDVTGIVYGTVAQTTSSTQLYTINASNGNMTATAYFTLSVVPTSSSIGTNGNVNVKSTNSLSNFPSIIKTYGDISFNITNPTSVNNVGSFLYYSSNTNVATISGTVVTIVGAGTTTITATMPEDQNYYESSVSTTLTVEKIPLDVKVENVTIKYGDEIPSFMLKYTGWKDGDGVQSLTVTPTIQTTASNQSKVGTYSITVSGGESKNYTFNYSNATLTIEPATLTVTVDSKSKVFGDDNPILTVKYDGWKYEDGVQSLSVTPTVETAALKTSGVGTYSITARGAVSENYIFNYVPGTLNVTKAALTIRAEDKTKVYGDANPALTVSYSGLVNGDQAPSTLATVVTTATASSTVGTYSITLSGASDANYDVTQVPGTLSVTKAALTIRAEDKTKVYGAANPALTVSYSGFISGDDESKLSTQPTASTTATTGSGVGTYSITVSGGSSQNYTFVYVSGKLEINPKNITVTPTVNTRNWDGSDDATLNFKDIFSNWNKFIVSGDGVELDTSAYVARFADAEIGKNKPVTLSVLQLKGANKNNYILNYPSQLKGEITSPCFWHDKTGKSDSLIRGTFYTKTYDGKTYFTWIFVRNGTDLKSIEIPNPSKFPALKGVNIQYAYLKNKKWMTNKTKDIVVNTKSNPSVVSISEFEADAPVQKIVWVIDGIVEYKKDVLLLNKLCSLNSYIPSVGSQSTKSLFTALNKGSVQTTGANQPVVRVNAFPNPYTDRITLQVTSTQAGKASLILYSISGQKLKTLFDGDLKVGTHSFDYTIPIDQRKGLIYILQQNGRSQSGKLIGLN